MSLVVPTTLTSVEEQDLELFDGQVEAYEASPEEQRWMESIREFGRKELLGGRPDNACRRQGYVASIADEMTMFVSSGAHPTQLSPRQMWLFVSGFTKRIEHLVAASQRYVNYVHKQGNGQNIPDKDFVPMPGFKSIRELWESGIEGQDMALDIVDGFFVEAVALVETLPWRTDQLRKLGEKSPVVYSSAGEIAAALAQSENPIGDILHKPRSVAQTFDFSF